MSAGGDVEMGWHLDRRVPVSIIFVLIVQLVGGLWFMFELRADINTNARDITRIDKAVDAMSQASQQQAVQLGRIEEQISGLRVDIQRLLDIMKTSSSQVSK